MPLAKFPWQQCRLAAGLCLLLAMAGCGPYLLFDSLETARNLAAKSGWREARLSGSTFTLAAFHTPAVGQAEALHVYIEGDGRAWRSRSIPPSDPTPSDPLGLRLALADPAPEVLYLARPCQYVRDGERRNCDSAYWTSYRFAPEVIAATNEAIDSFLARHPASRPGRKLVLFGYSGGGDVAALVAARRTDVAALVTVAAPLDHAAWTRHHAVSPLSDSLNPAAAPELLRLRQHHFLGGRDSIVPPDVVRPFIERQVAAGASVQTVVMPAYDHECCWADNWQALLTRLALP